MAGAKTPAFLLLFIFLLYFTTVDDKNFEKVKSEAEKFYKSIGKVFCPYFGESISFNSKGLSHIKFKSKWDARDRKDQFMRLKNIKLAPEILKKSHTLQELKHAKTFVDIKTNSRKERILKQTVFYGFIAIIRDGNFDKRLKIIIKEVSGGEKHFWSIVPYWKSSKELKLHSGNIEED